VIIKSSRAYESNCSLDVGQTVLPQNLELSATLVTTGISVLTLRSNPRIRPGDSSLQEVQPALVHGVSGGAATAPAEGYTAKATRRGIAFAPSAGLPVTIKLGQERLYSLQLNSAEIYTGLVGRA
jgi:hypothetical protein